jgi:hypothetical protein
MRKDIFTNTISAKLVVCYSDLILYIFLVINSHENFKRFTLLCGAKISSHLQE